MKLLKKLGFAASVAIVLMVTAPGGVDPVTQDTRTQLG